MRLALPVLAWLMFPSLLLAQGSAKPILMLDAGGHSSLVQKVLFMPDGKELLTVSQDKTIRCWDVDSGALLRVLRPPIGKGKEGMLYAGALSPDGRTLAVSGLPVEPRGNDYPIYLIAPATGRIVQTLSRQHTEAVNALAFSPDGTYLASGSGDKTACVWNMNSGRCEKVLKGHTKEIYDIAFSPDGNRLATASFDGSAGIWSVSDGRPESLLRGHGGEVRCVAWSPDGQALATGCYDRIVRVWEVNGRLQRAYPRYKYQIVSLAFSPDGKHLLVMRGINGAACSLLDLATSQEVMFPLHTDTVRHGAFSPDGSLIATTGGKDAETYLWRPADAGEIYCLVGKGQPVWSAAWSGDGKTIAWGHTLSDKPEENHYGPLERSFRLTDLEFGEPPGNGTYRGAQVQDGTLRLAGTRRREVTVYRNNRPTGKLQMDELDNAIHCYTLLPGERAAVGAEFGLYLFDTRTGKKIRKFQGHTDRVRAVAPSPDGRYLLSASHDQTLAVWDPQRDDPLLAFFFVGDGWIAWTPEGYYAASPSGEGLMGWHLNSGTRNLAKFYPAAQFHKSLYRPDVIKELLPAGNLVKALGRAGNQHARRAPPNEPADHPGLVGGQPPEPAQPANAAGAIGSQPTEVAKVLPPEVEILAPTNGQVLAQPEVQITAAASGASSRAVTSMRLLLDGRPLAGDADLRKGSSAKPRAEASWTIKLTPGRHRLMVRADSAVSKGFSAEVAVNFQAEKATEAVVRPALYVLAIGISSYPGELKLDFAHKDAQAIEQAFQQHSKGLFREVQTNVLVNDKASRQGILEGLDWLRKSVTQRDVAVLFYSGHGERDTDNHFYLLPVDGNPEKLLSSAIRDETLKAALTEMPCKVLALLDACHAGGLGGDRRKGATDNLLRDLLNDDSGVVMLCSSTARQLSIELAAQQQGCFTLALVEALAGKKEGYKGANGAVYLHHLTAYVTDRVKELTSGKQQPVGGISTAIRSFPLSKP